jgi:hypothetical protein
LSESVTLIASRKSSSSSTINTGGLLISVF